MTLDLSRKSVRDLERRLNKVGRTLDRKTRFEIIRPVVKSLVVPRARALAPRARKTIIRYIDGIKVAWYTPGNLIRSLKTLTFSRSWAVFAGTIWRQKSFWGTFNSEVRSDGWYGHFLEFGTQRSGQEGIRARNFMLRAFKGTKREITRRIVINARKVIDKAANKLKLK